MGFRMILRNVEVLIDKGEFSKSAEWINIRKEITESIQSLEHPLGAGKFLLRDESGKKAGRAAVSSPFVTCFVKSSN